MTEYASNSHKARAGETNKPVPAKRVEKVISGTAKVKKKSEIRKFTDVFLQEDMDSVKNYIIMDVVIPAIKTAICDVVKNGVDMLLYGESSIQQRKSPGTKISYRQFYGQNNDRRDISEPRVNRATYDYNDIIISNDRGEAEKVLATLDELMSAYGIVSVADFYEAVDVTGTYVDNNYGWTDISSARVVRTRDGYMIKFPKAMPLD